LTFLFEREKQERAKSFHTLLLEMKTVSEQYYELGISSDARRITAFEKRFEEYVQVGLAQNPVIFSEVEQKKKGYHKQSPSRNLLDTFVLHRKKNSGLSVRASYSV
jgi:hypothetical protein